MKKLLTDKYCEIHGGRAALQILAATFIRSVEYAFDQWKDSRIKKFARLDREEANLERLNSGSISSECMREE